MTPRLRYQDSILFLDVTSVVASYGREVTVGATSNVDPPSVTGGVSGGLTWSETPTVTYAPLQGEDFAKRLLAPIPPTSILLLSRSGWGPEHLLICAAERLNELPNGTAIGGVAPVKIKNFQGFRRVATLLGELQENGQIQLNTLVGTADKVVLSPGPVPMDDAARRKAEEIVTLLRITPTNLPPVESPGNSRALPGVDQSSVAPEVPSAQPSTTAQQPTRTSEGPAAAPTTSVPAAPSAAPAAIAADAPRFPRSPAHIVLGGRSILGVMAFLAQHVEVPQEHVQRGLVRVALGPDGKLFDWGTLGSRLFRVRNGASEPDHAYSKVRYRGYWFWIDDTDVESKSTYRLIAELFSLQAASGAMQLPVLTIPTR